MATTELKCDKHHTPTQLTCAQCGKPSCTKCLVWTEVGQKCRTCVPNRGGSRRNPIVVPALIVAALVFLVLGALGVFSGDSASKVPVSANRGPTQPGMGQPARDGALTFVVTRFDCGAKDVGDGPNKRTALGRYCLLEFKATNSGTQPTAFSSTTQSLLDGQRRRFAPDATATRIYQGTVAPSGLTSTVQQLNPGAEISTSIIYDIPEGVAPELAELRAGNTLGVTVRLTEAAGGVQG